MVVQGKLQILAHGSARFTPSLQAQSAAHRLLAFCRVVERLMMRHDPVMVREILDLFDLQPGQTVVDGTLGLAGHARKFAEQVYPGGKVLGMDWDAKMLGEAHRRLSDMEGVDVLLANDDFRNMRQHVEAHGLSPNAILLDLGLNLAQIEDPERGIAFSSGGPLDMRMDRSKGDTAASLLNRLSPLEIEQILFEFGDERWARAIARKVVERRKDQPLRTTQDLVDCVLAAIPAGARDKRIHPATRTFQAVRIAVNRELEGLDQAIKEAAHTLAPGGTLAVLSYHSGEDRVVKHAFRELAQNGFAEISKKPIQPQEDEVRSNPRSRSAKLRTIRRLAL
jgi:16S rRNA (cytosine1402-N4)-methyltransferase